MTYGTPVANFSALSNLDTMDIFIRMVYGEARGESWTGKCSVVRSVYN